MLEIDRVKSEGRKPNWGDFSLCEGCNSGSATESTKGLTINTRAQKENSSTSVIYAPNCGTKVDKTYETLQHSGALEAIRNCRFRYR